MVRRYSSTTPVVFDPQCRCLVCRAHVSPWAIDELEVDIMNLVAELLDRGWTPAALVDEVDQHAGRGPHAGRIVVSALVSHAGYWMDDHSMRHLLSDVDELTAGFHHLVGRTGPGWLARYAHSDADVHVALEGVVDVLEILPMLPCPSPVDRTARASDVWRRHRP